MQAVVFGLLTGSVLAVATVGFSMIRQSEGFLNIAHGQFLALGGLLGVLLIKDAGMNIFLGGLLAAIATGIAGTLIARVIFTPVKTKGTLVLFFSSVGLAYAMYGVLHAIFGPDIHVYPVDFGDRFEVLSMELSVGELVVIAIAGVVVVALHVFLNKTSIGLWIRATASNDDLARARGIPSATVASVVWFVGTALAGLAGVMIGATASVNTEMGWSYMFLVLAVAVVGGLGSIYGVIVAGFLLGLAMDLSTLVIPTQYRPTVAFAAIILTLILRPEGLFRVARRGEDIH
jgi:branched-chain amino acid transport system permease protein